ncbi:MAG: glycogen synthase [Clostridia bacterium]|nr:glycogen synthase [Clostridia bacterium]
MATATKSTTKTTKPKIASAKSAAEKPATKSAKKPTTTAPKTVKTVEKAEEKKKILFVASESTPFIATGGLAEVIGSLSTALAATGKFDVRVVIPLFSDIKKEYRDKFNYLGNLYVHLAWRNQYCGIFSYEKDGVTYYFIDNEFYFKRPGCYGYYDDGERFAFFSKSVLEIMPFLNFYPDVMHCHDWQAALAAIYLKTNYCFRPEYQFIRALFTIHNIEYQGQYSLDLLGDLFDIYGTYQYLVEYNNSINLMKGAIECCERFSTVSPRYAQEIKDPYFAHGLDPIIRKNEFKLTGILNGIDDIGYNCELDSHMFANYTPKDFSNKAVCKRELQKMLGLPQKSETPIIALISRLVSHKGLDLVTNVIEDLLQDDVQVVILGTGDAHFEGFFGDLAYRYSDKMSANIQFNGDLARKIYSGADIFLMPSKSEPCGLSQMIACRYGTVPIVRETGGLYDSIKPLENGYTFSNYNAHDMLYVIREAVSAYKNKAEWAKLMYRAATTDFSWSHSAKDYEALYYDMLK